MTTAALKFGSLDLKLEPPSFGIPDPGEPHIAVLAEGTDPGNPEAIVAAIASMLMDGDKAEVTRSGNQIARYPIEISGDDLDVVAAGEAMLMAEVNRGRNTTTWTPPGPAEPNVHDVVYSTLEFHFDDLAENRATRYFTLVLECIPFARRAEPTVVVAEPIPDVEPTWTTIDDCTSLTGWSTPSGTLSLADGGTAVQVANTAFSDVVELQRSGLSAPVAAGSYLVVEWEVRGTAYPPTPTLRVNGVPTAPAAIVWKSGQGAQWFVEVPATVADINLTAPTNTLGGYLLAHELSSVDALPFIGTRRQRTFTAQIGGTARTQADLVVEGESGEDLGDELLVYTAPVGAAMDPSLRGWREDGPEGVADPDAVSGFWTPLGAPSEFLLPIPRSGTHLLVGRLNAALSTTSTVSWSLSNATDTYAAADDVVEGSISINVAATPQFYALGVVTLPTLAVPAGSPTMQYLSIHDDTEVVSWDDLWLFNIDKDVGKLSWFSGMYDSPLHPSRAVMRSASLDSPRPAWLVGDASDPSLDVDVSRRMKSPGEHQFPPGLISILTVSTNARARVTLSAYPRFMHHVTKPAA